MAALYSLHGVVLQSDLVLDAEQLHGVDAEIRFELVDEVRAIQPCWFTARLMPDGTPWMSLARDGDRGYVISVAGEAEFLIARDGTRIVCAPASGSTPQALEPLFVEQVLPQVLALRRQPVLHASSVLLDDGGVVAFMGRSGAGKSTIAASLSHGRALVSDDCLVGTVLRDAVVVHGDRATLRLRPDSATRLFGIAANGEPKVRVSGRAASGPFRLRCIYLLEEAAETEVSIAPVRRRDAVVALAQHLYRLDPEDRSQLAAELDALGRTVGSVRVSKLCYPRDFAALPAVERAVVEDVQHSAASMVHAR